MISGYNSFVAYFRKLAWQHTTLLGSFFVGDSWTLISAQRSDVQYPAMWLERPIIRPVYGQDEDSLQMRSEGAFSIVANVAPDDWEKQEGMLRKCQIIASDLITRMKSDSDADEFDLFVDLIRMDSLAVMMADDLHGWRVEFSLKSKGWDDCVNPLAWKLLDENNEENLPLEPDYLPFEDTAEAFVCDGTAADFAFDYTPTRGLLLTDTSTYKSGDRRRDVLYTITDGIETVVVNEYHRVLTDAQLATLDYNAVWTITQTVKTMRGCLASRSFPFDVKIWGGSGTTPPPTGVSVIDSANSRLLDSGSDAIIE